MNIAVYGSGVMSSLVREGLENTEGFNFVGMVDSRTPNKENQIYSSLKEITLKIDGIIDFSHPSNLETLLEYAKENQTPIVIATTGFEDEDIKKIEEASKKAPIVFTYNTSLGVNILGEIAKQVTQSLNGLFDIEIIEKHHNKKLDAPSGTAKLLYNKVEEGSSVETNPVYGRSGMSKREKNEVGIHAIRGGSIVGEHSVIFAGEDEIIEIKHEALSKKIFANGALKAINYLQTKENNLYTMKDVLGL